MCKSPIKIRNNSKYITDNTGHQLYIWVNCGHCSECKKEKQLEWNLRTYYQTLETLTENGWLYFDTLTYRNETLPRLNKQMKDISGNPLNFQYACFKPQDIRDFYETLRGWYGDNAFKYFIVSEYGEIKNRPHYHILLFVNNEIEDQIEFSRNVAKAWNKGRTDGIPYKSRNYVLQHNVITKMNLDAIRYIAKYVSKSQHFTNIVEMRWNKIANYYTKHAPYKYNEMQLKKLRAEYLRNTTPFHRQSQHFGETALLYIDMNDLIENGRIYYKDDSLKINQYTSLPMYFKRKLTQKQIKYNGKRIWVNTEFGINFKKARESKTLEKITDRYLALNIQHGKPYSEDKIKETAYYILFERGRLKGQQDYKAHHEEATHFNYNTNKDKKYLGKYGISKYYAGNDKIGYETTIFELDEDIENTIYINNELETIIDTLKLEQDDKTLVLLKEHMREIKKIFFQF